MKGNAGPTLAAGLSAVRIMCRISGWLTEDVSTPSVPRWAGELSANTRSAGDRLTEASRHLLACLRDPAATERFLAQTEAALRGTPATPLAANGNQLRPKPGDGRGR